MTSEAGVQQYIRLEAANLGVLLWRNNSGVAGTEGHTCSKCGNYDPPNGRPVRYGLGNDSAQLNKRIKSSDLIGVTPVVITQEMVGRTLGVFTAVEVKHSDWTGRTLNERETAQLEFITLARSVGAMAGFAIDIETFRSIVGK